MANEHRPECLKPFLLSYFNTIIISLTERYRAFLFHLFIFYTVLGERTGDFIYNDIEAIGACLPPSERH